MNNLEKLAFFRDSATKQQKRDNQMYLALHAQRRKNAQELHKYRPVKWLAQGGSSLLTAGALWRINPWLALASIPVAGWLGGRVVDDMTGRTKLKQDNRHYSKLLDARDTWQTAFDASEPSYDIYNSYKDKNDDNKWFDSF